MAAGVVSIALARGVLQSTWSGLVSTEEGDQIDAALYSDKCVQIGGAFSTTAPTVTIKGSNDGTSWFTLTDPQGNNLTFTTSGMEQIMENPRYIRPETSGGATGTAIDVIIISRGGQP